MHFRNETAVRKQEYYLQGGGVLGMTQKQFWFSINDANWFLQSQTFASASYVITSKACEETVSLGQRFLDAGHPAVSFEKTALKKLSHDARKTGGIVSMGAVNPGRDDDSMSSTMGETGNE